MLGSTALRSSSSNVKPQRGRLYLLVLNCDICEIAFQRSCQKTMYKMHFCIGIKNKSQLLTFQNSEKKVDIKYHEQNI